MYEAVLSKYKITDADLLGEGGETLVYALPEENMLRLHKGNLVKKADLEILAAFYAGIEGKFSFQTPRILEIHEENGALYTISKCIRGRDMSKVLPGLNAEDKKKVLQNYFDAMEEIHSVSFPADKQYGQILVEHPLRCDTWPKFLRETIHERAAAGATYLQKDVGEVRALAERLSGMAAMFDEYPPKELVHGDFFPHNILTNDALEIVGVIDMSNLTVVGDHRMDVASSYLFLETAIAYSPEDSDILWPIVERKYGRDFLRVLNFYRAYYAIYFSDAASEDAKTYPKLYSWCVANLKKFQES